MKAVCIVLWLLSSLGLMWIGIHELLGVVPFPFPSRGPSKNIAALVCLGLVVICGRVAASKGRAVPAPDVLPDKGDTRAEGGTERVVRTPDHEPARRPRFRVTTARERGAGVEVHEVEGDTPEEATAFAVLLGLTVVAVEDRGCPVRDQAMTPIAATGGKSFEEEMAKRAERASRASLPIVMGDEAGRTLSEEILAQYLTGVTAAVSWKTKQCFEDRKRHSVVMSCGNVYVVVDVHPGPFHVVAPSLHGELIARTNLPGLSFDADSAQGALLMLDYFIHDPANSASPVDLAVSFVALNSSLLPKNLASKTLVHVEMLSQEEKTFLSIDDGRSVNRIIPKIET